MVVLVGIALIAVTRARPCRRLFWDCVYERSGTSLLTAAHRGDLATVRNLLDQGHDANEVDPHDNSTPLIRAASENRLNVMQLLIGRGADVNKGYPLGAAAVHNNREAVKVLLSHGADLGRSRVGDVPVAFLGAAQHGHLDMLKLLSADGAGIRSLSDRGRAHLLCSAIWMGQEQPGLLEMVTYLLSQGAPVNLAVEQGQTPLHLAAQAGRADVAEFLLQSGANAQAVDATGKTPLDYARESRRAEIVRMLENPAAVLRTPRTSSRATTPE